MANYPDSLLYTKEHEWIKVDGKSALVGITSYAIEQLGDVVHLELPKVGASYKAGDSFGTIESTKTVSDLYMPVAGKVVEVNASLKDAPETITEDPHGKCWLVKIELDGAPGALMKSAEYQKYIETH